MMSEPMLTVPFMLSNSLQNHNMNIFLSLSLKMIIIMFTVKIFFSNLFILPTAIPVSCAFTPIFLQESLPNISVQFPLPSLSPATLSASRCSMRVPGCPGILSHWSRWHWNPLQHQLHQSMWCCQWQQCLELAQQYCLNRWRYFRHCCLNPNPIEIGRWAGWACVRRTGTS